jgi:hypothetical protein
MHGTTHRLMGICEVSPKLGSVRPPTVEAVSRKEVNDGKDRLPEFGRPGAAA